jgi:hypothetical protein
LRYGERLELARHRLADSWNPLWISPIELPHVLEIADRKAISEFSGQPGCQIPNEFLAILSAVSTVLFLLEDSAANLVVR